eukprot:2521618-Amphidinium_carterae.1
MDDALGWEKSSICTELVSKLDDVIQELQQCTPPYPPMTSAARDNGMTTGLIEPRFGRGDLLRFASHTLICVKSEPESPNKEPRQRGFTSWNEHPLYSKHVSSRSVRFHSESLLHTAR